VADPRSPEQLRREAARIMRASRETLDREIGTALQLLQQADRLEAEQAARKPGAP